MVPDRSEIEATIASTVRRTMLLDDAAEIGSTTSLIGDLGVGSLDLVEIVYEIEEAFDVQVVPDELFPQGLLRDPAYVEDGRILEPGIAKLREQYGFTEVPEIAPGTPIADIVARLLTLRVLVDYVAHLLEDRRE